MNTRSLVQKGGASKLAAGTSRKSSGHEDTPCSAYTRLFRSCGAVTRAAQLDTSEKSRAEGPGQLRKRKPEADQKGGGGIPCHHMHYFMRGCIIAGTTH